jgi:uncharacterized membrane protein YkgB
MEMLFRKRDDSGAASGSRIESIGASIVNNIKALLESSPILGPLSRRIGLRWTARLIGVTELAIAGLVALPRRRSRLATLGSVLALGMFATTLSFLFSTPAARTKSTKGVPILSDAGQFLVKDVVLLGASVMTLGESLRAHALAPEG